MANVSLADTVKPNDDGRHTVVLTSNAVALFVMVHSSLRGRFDRNGVLLLPGLSVELAFISWGPQQDSLRRYTWTASTSVLGIKKWRCRVYVKTQIDLNLMIQLVFIPHPCY